MEWNLLWSKNPALPNSHFKASFFAFRFGQRFLSTISRLPLDIAGICEYVHFCFPLLSCVSLSGLKGNSVNLPSFHNCIVAVYLSICEFISVSNILGGNCSAHDKWIELFIRSVTPDGKLVRHLCRVLPSYNKRQHYAISSNTHTISFPTVLWVQVSCYRMCEWAMPFSWTATLLTCVYITHIATQCPEAIIIPRHNHFPTCHISSTSHPP